MIKTKRFLACILAATMICSFASCRKNNKSGEDGNDESSNVSLTEDNSNSSTDSSSEEESVIGTGSNASSDTSSTGKTTNTSSIKTGGTTSIDPNKNTDKKYDVNTAIDTEQEKLFAKSLKGKTIKVASNSSKPTEDDINIAKACKEKYGLNVDLYVLPWEQAQGKIPALVAAGTAPDVASFSEVLALRYAYGNLAQPIDKYLVKSDPVWTKNSSLDRFTFAGKCYGAADFDYDVFLVYYNKTLFNEKHVQDPYELYKNGQWTFDKFREIAKKITIMQSDGKKVKTFGCCTWNYPVFMQANGVQGVQFINGKWSVTIDQPTAMQGMQIMHDLAADGSFLMSDGYQDFRTRTVAMTIERPGNAIGNNDYYNRMEDEIGMVPMPKASNGKYYAPVVSNARYVPNNVKNPLGAVAYMYEKRIYDIQKSTNTNASYLKDRRKIISDEHLAIYNDYMKKATPMSCTMDGLANWWDGALNRNQVWNKIIQQKMQPSQAVDSIRGIMLDCLKKTVGPANTK